MERVNCQFDLALFAGPKGVGKKKTALELIRQNVFHSRFDMGDFVRREKQFLSLSDQENANKSLLISDDTVRHAASGYIWGLLPNFRSILDGYARNRKQAEHLLLMKKQFEEETEKGLLRLYVVHLLASKSLAEERRKQRAVEENRPDDADPKSLENGHEQYLTGVLPALAFLENEGIPVLKVNVQRNETVNTVAKNVHHLVSLLQ